MIIVTFLIFGIFISYLILQHRKVETHLQEVQERFKLVADFAQDWEYWITKDRRLNYVSPSAERITGYKPEEFMKDNTLLEKIVHPDDKEKYVNHTVQSLCETDLESFDFRIITKDHQIRWIEHSCQSVYDPKGMYLGHRASNKDITLN
ncbi:MAG: PAS domain-containing protein, partial [Candidatus Scalindua sp.]